jgi:hypothetical protein
MLPLFPQSQLFLFHRRLAMEACRWLRKAVTPAILVLWRLRQEANEFKAGLGCIVKPCLRTTTTKRQMKDVIHCHCGKFLWFGLGSQDILPSDHKTKSGMWPFFSYPLTRSLCRDISDLFAVPLKSDIAATRIITCIGPFPPTRLCVFKHEPKLATVAHVCNPSYSGGGD